MLGENLAIAIIGRVSVNRATSTPTRWAKRLLECCGGFSDGLTDSIGEKDVCVKPEVGVNDGDSTQDGHSVATSLESSQKGLEILKG